MPSSNRGMFGRGNGTVTVIEQPVMRSYLRKAKIVFYVTLVITAILIATLTVALYVKELTTRPADVTAAVTSSLN